MIFADCGLALALASGRLSQRFCPSRVIEALDTLAQIGFAGDGVATVAGTLG
jgi:hypothetical protein